ncbi:3-hydroxyacyl-CoA dehydrogenase family protein [Catenulispora rubra]|uniref:3-hydroxyacyl-CoA dehydrogenase family protein n=1 Tax=Catenulispora rubra TaxID=280293 RepID=UPI0018925DBD
MRPDDHGDSALNQPSDNVRLTVVGAGVMGVSIAALAVSRGLHVTVTDNEPAKADAAAAKVAQELRLAKLVRAIPDDAVAGSLRVRSSVPEDVACDAVIEAVVETKDVKTKVLAEICEAVGPGVPIITNTSSIPVDELAAEVRYPESLLGVHFMNPAYLIATVEVIHGARTSEQVKAGAGAVLEALGRKGVLVGDGPGFVTSRVSHRMINDAIKVVEEGRASVEDVDLLMQDCLGHRTGPLRTADLIGLDNLADSLTVLHERTGDESFRPADLLLAKVAAGEHGRKSGRGFYSY